MLLAAAPPVLVYGDARRVEEGAAKVEGIRALLARWMLLPPGVERHAALAELLIETGELEQGLLDEQLRRLGEERPSPLADAAARLTRAAAELFRVSFLSNGLLPAPADVEEMTAPAVAALGDILGFDLPAALSITVPEGYAFYGLYPETYVAAAERAPDLDGAPARVIGIRSIGTSLAAAVAASAGDGSSTASVRWKGCPCGRTLAVGEELAARILAAADGEKEVRFAVADEGPGLSGSSFGSVADWLEEHGVPADSISFFPSHRGGPGPYAGERQRRRWERTRRHTADFEDLFVAPGARWPLAGWVEELTGPPEGELVDVSAGRWRERLFPDPALWPPAHLQQERRKYLLPAGGRLWLLKFAGLGRYGREKLDLACALEREGFIPPVAGLRHGFLVAPWLDACDGARPLPLIPVDRGALVEQVAAYLAFRAARFPAGEERRGASPEELLEMARFNAGQALGAEIAEELEAWRERLPDLAAHARPVLTDNRLHAWEWLVLPDGRIVKTDAIDHHRANDLVGEQDLAWDLAGAVTELELTEEERDLLLDGVARRNGTRSSPDDLRFYMLAYLAFHLGACSLGAETLAGIDAGEADRMRQAGDKYAAMLRKALVRL